MLRRYLLLRHRHRPKTTTTPMVTDLSSDTTTNGHKNKHHPASARRRRRANAFFLVLFLFLGILAVWFTRTRSYHHQQIQEEQRQRRSYIQNHFLSNHTHKCVLSIATLVSSRHRQETLVATLQSIVLDQTVVPRYIQIHYSSNNNNNITFPIQDMQARVQEQVLSKVKTNHIQEEVHITWHEAPNAWRSSAKVIGPLMMLSQDDNESSSSNIHVLIAADDDVVYHPTWLESLLVGHVHHPTSVIGMRGWRMHRHGNKYAYGALPIVSGVPDGIWGSFPATEAHVLMGGKLQPTYPYRVHVVTHVHGVLYPISFLVQQMNDMYNRTTTTQQQQVALGELLIGTPPLEKYRSMDDVWISGHMARLQIPRWIVPTVDQSVLSSQQYAGQVGIHLGQDQTVIPESRATTNQKVVDYFQSDWEDMQNDSPRLAGWLPLRHWLSRHVLIRAYQVYMTILESLGKKTKKGALRRRRGHR